MVLIGNSVCFQAFLKRLQNIRPSKGISRNEQLSAYNSTVLHGIPIATLHPTTKSRRSGRESSASSIVSSLGRTRSLTSIHSAATASSFGTTASRQSSRAGSRPSSAKKSVREKPPWNDRWWKDSGFLYSSKCPSPELELISAYIHRQPLKAGNKYWISNSGGFSC